MLRGIRHSGSVKGQHHEHGVIDDAAPPVSDRAVGLVFALAAAVIGLAPLFRGREARGWALALAAALLLVALARPWWLHSLGRAWMAFGRAANAIVTWALMALVFYGVVTPIAWALRRRGQDVLRLRFEPLARTYWLERRPPGPSPDTMKRQF
jgi:Saxitoxin biosynthesis operon protein SxtJ